MAVFNRIKEFLLSRPDHKSGKQFTSAYRFWQDTQMSRATAYRLYNDPGYIPTGDILEKICRTYKIKPGVILDWEPDEQPQASTLEQHQVEDSQQRQKPEPENHQPSKRARSYITVIPEIPESA